MIKSFVENNFNIVLVLFVVIGLIVPGLENLPKASAMTLISIAIFFSCSRVTIDELRHISLKSAVYFYVCRFLLLPLPLYYVALFFIPEYALGVFLVALLPVGASATAVAMVTRSNPSLALSGTIITNALAPFVLPVLLLTFAGSEAEIDVAKLFITLGVGIFLPALVYFSLARKVKRVRSFVSDHAQMYSTLCVGGMMMAVTAMERDYILNNLYEVGFITFIGCLLFVILFGFSMLFARNMNIKDKQTYMICSGVNNTGIGVGLAILYFSPATILFAVIAEVPWTLGLMFMKRYADRHV